MKELPANNSSNSSVIKLYMIGIQQASRESASSVYTGAFSYVKGLTLAFFGTVFAFASGFLINNAAYQQLQIESKTIVGLSVAVVLFLIFLTLEVMFLNRRSFLALSLLINSIGLAVGFFANITQYLTWALLAAAAIIVAGGITTRAALDDSLKVSFFRVANSSIKFGILALAIIASVLFFNVFSTKPIEKNNPILSEGLVDTTLKVLSKPLAGFFGGIDFSKSLREIASDMVDAQIQQNPNFKNKITPEQRQQIISGSIQDFQSRLGGVFGGQINVDEKLSTAFYGVLLNRLNTMPQNVRSIILIAGAVLVLFTVLAVSPIIRPIVAVLSFLFYEIFLALGFGAIVYETRSKETIVLP